MRKIKADFCDRGKVWIILTEDEYLEMKKAHLLSWLIFWKCPADLMSPELEDILCGHSPDRYQDRI